MEIYKNGYSYYIERYGIETDKELIERSWFIVNQLHNENSVNNEHVSDSVFENAVKNSILMHNMKVLKCKYTEENTIKITELIKNNLC